MLTVEYDLLGLQRGQRLLDLGCGGGRHTYAALQRGAHVVGVDLDRSLLGETAAMCAAMMEAGDIPEGTTATFICGDATVLPLASGSFDRVIASEVLEHIPDDGAAMSEIQRVLAPGGIAAVTVPRFWPERVCWILSDEYHANEGGHVRIYRSHELTQKLAERGLRPSRSHHAHALHAPYWWLKCASGVRDERAPLPMLYHKMLVWQMESGSRTMDLLERTLNPVLGKSYVVYAEKNGA